MAETKSACLYSSKFLDIPFNQFLSISYSVYSPIRYNGTHGNLTLIGGSNGGSFDASEIN